MKIERLLFCIIIFLWNVGILSAQSVVDPIPDDVPSKVLDATVSIVDVETIVETVERTSVKYGDFLIEGSEESTGSTTYKQKSGLISVETEERIVAVNAFNTDFDVADVLKVDDGNYLVRGPPGKYLAVVKIEVDGENLDKFLTFVIPQGDEPPPPPPGDYKEFGDLAVTLVKALDDEPTRITLVAKLGDLYTLTDSNIDLAEAQTAIKKMIADAINTRVGDSLDKDWFNGFRKPMSDAIEASDNITKEKLIGIWTTVHNALTTQFTTVAPIMKALPPVINSTAAPSVDYPFTPPSPPVISYPFILDCPDGNCDIQYQQRSTTRYQYQTAPIRNNFFKGYRTR